jgi:phage terminase small subunit
MSDLRMLPEPTILPELQLNSRQRNFISIWLTNGHNATKAATKAGYSSKTGRVTASKILRRHDVKVYIAQIETIADTIIRAHVEKAAIELVAGLDSTHADIRRSSAKDILDRVAKRRSVQESDAMPESNALSSMSVDRVKI